MKNLFEQFERLVEFPKGQGARVIMEDDGPLIEIFDPHRNQERLIIHELKAWAGIPALMNVALDQYCEHVTTDAVASSIYRVEYAGRHGSLARYLIDEGYADIDVASLRVDLVTKFIDHIISKNNSLSASLNDYRPLKDLVEFVLRNREFDAVRDPYLFAPRDPFTRSIGRGATVEVIPDPIIADMLRLAQNDCRQIMSRQRRFWRHVNQTAAIRSSADLRTSFDVAYHIFDRFGGELPSKRDIGTLDRTLHYKLSGAAGVCGFKDVVSLIHPTLADLIPFIFLLAVYTQFNLSVMLPLSWDLVDFIDQGADGRRVVLEGYKARAKRVQRRTFLIDEQGDNPANILKFLKEWTQHIRLLLSSNVQDRVFAFWSLKDGRVAGSHPSVFEDTRMKEAVSDGRFASAYKAYWKAKGPEYEWNYSSIRPTALSLVNRAFDGDLIATATLANHRSMDTFMHHYQSSIVRAQNESKMGKALMLRERMLATNGRYDPTKRGEGEGVDAVTPGFNCLDPTDSPMPAQKAGRLCSAYGLCPACPLATVDTRSPVALARLVQLENQYLRARDVLEAVYWRDKYQMQLRVLQEVWLKLFEPETFDQAQLLQVRPIAEIV